MTSTVLPPKKRAKTNLSLSFQAAAVVGGTSPGGDFDDNDTTGPCGTPSLTWHHASISCQGTSRRQRRCV